MEFFNPCGLFLFMNSFLSSILLAGGSFLNLQGTFEILTTNMISVEVTETLQSTRSPLICALFCLKRRVESLPCLAFGFNPLDRTCTFYKEGGTDTHVPGSQVFWFKTTDAFQMVYVKDHVFSIYLSSVEKTYNGARDQCRHLGGYLLEIRSLEIYDAISKITEGRAGSAFVGGNDNALEGKFVHDRDGTQIDDGVLKWSGDEGSSTKLNENCLLLILEQLNLYDIPCDLKRLFLCERDI